MLFAMKPSEPSALLSRRTDYGAQEAVRTQPAHPRLPLFAVSFNVPGYDVPLSITICPAYNTSRAVKNASLRIPACVSIVRIVEPLILR